MIQKASQSEGIGEPLSGCIMYVPGLQDYFQEVNDNARHGAAEQGHWLMSWLRASGQADAG